MHYAEKEKYNITVLIVDDNLLNIEFLRFFLENIGCKVFSASNGKKALEIFNKENEKFDLIFLDIEMPVLNGIQLLKILKMNQHQYTTKICGYSSLLNADNYEDYGFDYYLNKETSPKDIIALLNSLF